MANTINVSRVNKILKENPDIRNAIAGTIQEMRKPENMQKMANDILILLRFVSENSDKTPQEIVEMLRSGRSE